MQSECPLISTSMEPALFPGDRLLWQSVDFRELHAGDIILYLHGSSIIAHRLICMRKRGGKIVLVCKGDALPHVDAPVHANALLGRVEKIIRGGRCYEITRITNVAYTVRMLARWIFQRLFSGRKKKSLKMNLSSRI